MYLFVHKRLVKRDPMSNTQIGSYASANTNGAVHYIRSVFGPDWPYLKLLFLGVLVWFLLAQFSMSLVPDTSTSTGQNSRKYLEYVLRNGKIYLVFVMVILSFRVMVEAKKADRGQSALVLIFGYLRRVVQEWWVGPKKQVLGIPAFFLLAMLTFALFLFSYSTIKTRVPEFMPFGWDVTFMKMDQALFFGKDAWQVFAFLYDYPKIILFLDFVYDLWAGILVTAWFVTLGYGGKDKPRRYQFVLSLMLIWFLGGNVMAILLSTAGPVYFEAVTGLASSFDEQMAALAAINAQTPLRAFEYQAFLWDVYENPGVGLGGIAAMPSMHNASALLLYIMFARGPITKILFGSFVLLIFVGSFMLAWHYVVDALLVVPVVIACWKLAGWIVNKATVTD